MVKWFSLDQLINKQQLFLIKGGKMGFIKFFSILSILFGALIILMPQILAYLVAVFFIILGMAGLGASSGGGQYIKIVRKS